ncbi:fatty-acyl-CoA synthase [Xylariaceae sp. FL1651]|nr:fatty-acyl-CoA synthase [Xylariaceae sp. FL1651]
MSLTAIAAAAAGTAALAAYLDARFLIRNDLRQGNRKLNMWLNMRFIAQKMREEKLLIYNIFEDRAGTAEGNNTFLLFEDRQWTYTEFYDALQPIANWLLKDLGIKKGEVIVTNGGNTPEYLLLMFALEAIGAVPALINYNLTGAALIHSVKLATSRYVIADEDVRALVSPVEPELSDAGIQTIYYSPTFLGALNDREPLPKSRRTGLDPLGPGNLLYTSGTTGMPKGVVTNRARRLQLGRGIGMYLRLKPGDRMYTCLPLYHASAFGLCTLPCIYTGAAVVLSRKFSHATFWPEVHKHKATHIQYVGELCRYLVNAPPSPLDRGHNVRVAWGNGMRPDVWESFRERFGVECINELYGASDGMATTLNANRGDFSRNAIAVRGPLWHLMNRDEKRILIDPDSQDVIRGKDGFAIEAKAEETGEIVIQMDAADPDRGTPEYFNNRSATEKRRISDVFRKGDLWFRSGDLFKLDSQGRLFFIDRLGDTFRWHSENVSTNEVSDVIGKFPDVAETNVYGVLVPNADGRAGCAAIVPTDEALKGKGIDWTALAEHCLASLPRYAVPIFIRLTKSLVYTETHKLQKQKLRSEGIDLAAISQAASDDQIYWLPPGTKTYVPFKEKDYQELKAGRVRL